MSSQSFASADLTELPPYQKRSFVPPGVDLTDAGTVTGLYEQLAQRPVKTAQELERWVLDRSELDAALSQAGSILYIRMTCHTDDKEIAGAYTKFIQTVPPAGCRDATAANQFARWRSVVTQNSPEPFQAAAAA